MPEREQTEGLIGLKAIRVFFEEGKHGRKVELQELKELKESKEDYEEIARLCEEEVNK